MAGNLNNSFTLPTFTVIYIVALVIIVVQRFAEVSFGILGFISWLVVIVGSVTFVIAMLAHVFNW